jgi:hypothetical protein
VYGNGGTQKPPNGGNTATGGVTAAGGFTETGGSPVPTGGVTANTGGGTSETGGVTTITGGVTASTGGNFNPFAGGSAATGATTSTGGSIAKTGGVTTRTGGIIIGGTGGAVSSGQSGTPLSSYKFGEGDEPCANPKDVSGKTGNIGTGDACYRTVDDISGWGCSNFDTRTVKINGVETECAAKLPPKMGSFYYFEIPAGEPDWASIYWYGIEHPVPDCGSFPPWVSGGTSEPCPAPATASP